MTTTAIKPTTIEIDSTIAGRELQKTLAKFKGKIVSSHAGPHWVTHTITFPTRANAQKWLAKEYGDDDVSVYAV